jgi:ubiquitin-protein ligase
MTGRRITFFSILMVNQTGTMVTKIFHPNISKAGEICVDTLKKGWKREYGIEHVLVVR